MIKSIYANAFTEVYVILNFLEKKDLEKIPSNFINVIKDNQNPNYKCSITPEKKLKDQQILPETKAILFNIYKDFFATETQKETINKWQLEEFKKLEIEKNKKYNNNIFKKIIPSPQLENNYQLIEIKESNIQKKIKKIIRKILDFFK